MSVTETNRGLPVEPREKGMSLHPSFLKNNYEIKRKFFKFGETFDICDAQNNFLIRSKREPLHIKKIYHFYADKDKTEELLRFKTRGKPPETFDVVDPDDTNIGSIQHNISGSFPRTTWDIKSAGGETIGSVRRMKTNKAWHRHGPKVLFYPSYEVVAPDNTVISTLQRKMSLTGYKFKYDILDHNTTIDRRLLMSANIIMTARELKRETARSTVNVV
jgi:uncharacterized protein YxjI